MMRLLSLLALLCLPVVAAVAQERIPSNAAETMVRRVSSNGQSFFRIDAAAFVHAPPEQAWRVLTDYDHLPDFVPNLLSSKRIARSDGAIVLEQEAVAGFLFISQRIHLVVRVDEHPPSAIDVTLVAGDLKHYAARWELAAATLDGAPGTRIRYAGQMEPAFFIPPLLAEALVGRDVNDMVDAVVAEIERRRR